MHAYLLLCSWATDDDRYTGSAQLVVYFLFPHPFPSVFLRFRFRVLQGGSLLEQPFAVSGSGSVYALGYCDDHLRPGLGR